LTFNANDSLDPVITSVGPVLITKHI